MLHFGARICIELAWYQIVEITGVHPEIRFAIRYVAKLNQAIDRAQTVTVKYVDPSSLLKDSITPH